MDWPSFDKVKCFLSLHNGKWEFETSDSCNQTRICESCGTKEDRVEHDLGDEQYISSENCYKARICLRCGYQSSRSLFQNHSWSRWDHEQSGSCTVARQCQHCDECETKMVHEWGEEWEYVSSNDCTVKKTCKICGTKEIVGERHTWGEWKMDDEEEIRSCLNCHETDYR